MLYPVLMKVGSDEADIPGGQPVNIHGKQCDEAESRAKGKYPI